MLAGVAAGVAETLDADPSLVRIIWALLAILSGGVAILVYIVMAIVVPEGSVEPWPVDASAVPPSPPSATTPPIAGSPAAPSQTRAEWRAARRSARRARRHEGAYSGETGFIFGVVLIVTGALFLLRQAVPWFDFHIWWPIGLVGLGLLLLLVAMRPGRPAE